MTLGIFDITNPMTCPRCEGRSFTEYDCGPDSRDDDITWQRQK